MRILISTTLIAICFLQGCNQLSENVEESKTSQFSIPNEKIVLENGLEVILHVDKSDPVVAVSLTAHVGSAREKTGRTGFAHLFEHLLFLESENLGKGGLDEMSARIGGSGANGSTGRDRTNYFQTVPKDALEKMIWAEADKLGWFINTVTGPVLAKEKQVVKNEKRQSIDNRPYGHTRFVIDKNLYPSDHPYNWQVIGSLEDLQNATLDDVKEFFKKWYVPNNVTLVISGSFDTEQAIAWVKKYFDEIPRGQSIAKQSINIPVLSETKNIYYEDNFAQSPELTLTWPTVEQYHPDAYALSVLTQYLSNGKEAPLYKILVEDKKLTSRVNMFNFSSEIAGSTSLSVRAFSKVNLNEVSSAIKEAFAKFEQDGFLQADLDRIKASEETNFYNGLSSVLGKGFQLAQYNIFAGDPNFVRNDIENILAVTRKDVLNVYNKYFKNKHFVATSFVPKGDIDLAMVGSFPADIQEEQIVQGAEESFDPSQATTYTTTPSTFDRNQEPPYGDSLQILVPEVWKSELGNGLKIYGIENNEVPLIRFNLEIKGGQAVLNNKKLGLANLVANMMTKGTKDKTPAEFEAAIQQLGATINVTAGYNSIEINGTTLSRNYDQLLLLIEEILLQPRWDEKEFELIKSNVKDRINQQKANPRALARDAFDQLVYAKDDFRSQSMFGTEASIEELKTADMKEYFNNFLSPSAANFHIVGNLSKNQTLAGLERISTNWKQKDVEIPELKKTMKVASSKIYFYDVPGAKQSILRIGYPTVAGDHPDFRSLNIANYMLGDAGFVSRLTQSLREGHGYTYGINSDISGDKFGGLFTINTGVRTNVTLESMQLIKQILADYSNSYSKEDLSTTKSFLTKSNARAFETSRAKLSILKNMSHYQWDADYINKQDEIVKLTTVNDMKEISGQYIDPNKMIWVVVGDKATQFERLSKLGFGKPVLINDRISE